MQAIENSPTVLIADDDATLSGLWREVLSNAGYNVLTANTGMKVLDAVRYRDRIDVILLDFKMPVLDGGETLRHLTSKFPRIKTIGVTGLREGLPASYSQGVNQLLIKPVQTSELINTISSVVGPPQTEETQAKAAKPPTNWVRLSLYYALLLVCTASTLLLLRQAASQLLSTP